MKHFFYALQQYIYILRLDYTALIFLITQTFYG